jgi:hypothetical protein
MQSYKPGSARETTGSKTLELITAMMLDFNYALRCLRYDATIAGNQIRLDFLPPAAPEARA